MQFGVVHLARDGAWRASLAVFIGVVFVLPAHAQVTMTRTLEPVAYTAGMPVDITLTIDVESDTPITALGAQENTPETWTFDSLVSGALPQVAPGQGETGPLEFAWFPPPPLEAFPITFTYRMNVPPSATGTEFLSGEAVVLISGEEFSSGEVNTIATRQGEGPFHSADFNLSGTIQLNELLRVIQFFNVGGFHCADSPDDTDDGFAAGLLGSKACDFHHSDYNPQDWRIGLAELLRLIQFFNLGGYFACEGTVDGFCVN